MNDKILLHIKNLSFGYGNSLVLDQVQFEIAEGDFWFFLGVNGSGKTTLLNCILGTLPPNSGEVVRHPDLASQSKMGLIPQFHSLNPALPTSVREVVSMGLVGVAIERKEEPHRIAWALERVRMTGLSKQNFWTLSGGQKQRVFIARALVRMPRIILMDEPTNNLDFPSEEDFLNCLERLRHEDQMTLIFVSHNLRLAKERASHVALFQNHRIIAGEKNDVLTKENLQITFHGSGNSQSKILRMNGGKNA